MPRLLTHLAVVCTIVCILPTTQALAVSNDTTGLWKKLIGMDRKMWENFPRELAKAETIHREALATHDERYLARSFYTVGKFYWADGQYGLALSCFWQSKRHAVNTGDKRMAADVQNLAANTYYYQGLYDSAGYYFRQAFLGYEQLQDVDGMIKVSNNLSMMYHRKGDYRKTIEYIVKTEKLKEQQHQLVADLDTFKGLAGLMIDSILYVEEISAAHQDIQRLTKAHDTVGLYGTHFNLSNAYLQLGDPRKAVDHMAACCRLMAALGQRPYWDALATAYQGMEKEDSCFYYHYQSVREFPTATRLSVLHTWELMGDSFAHFNHLDSAIVYYEKALVLNTHMNNRITVAGLHYSLANTYFKMKKWDQAEAHLLLGTELARQVTMRQLLNFYQLAAELHAARGQYDKAYTFRSLYATMSDSVKDRETAANLVRLQAEFETARKQREVNRLQRESQLNDALLKARSLQIALVAGLAIIFATGLGWYYYRARKRKQHNTELAAFNALVEKQNAELTRQNEAKEALLHEIHHRVKNNLQIISSLIALKARHVAPETSDVLQQLGNRIYSMGLVHEKLYRHEDVSTVRLDWYLPSVISQLIDSLTEGGKPTNFHPACEQVTADAGTSLTLALVCNELVTNSLKYAFPEEQMNRNISLQLKKVGRGLALIIYDNGTSAKAGTVFEIKSFGLRFVDQLITSKLQGHWDMRVDGGLVVTMRIPNCGVGSSSISA